MTRVQLAPGYDISRVLKGGWQLAGGHGSIDVDAALRDTDRYVDAGITTFDCADIYLGVEALIGRWRQTRPAAAARVQIHTKYVPDLDRLPKHSRADVVRGIDRSLRRLGLDELAGGREQIVELDALVAGDARDRGLARGVACGEGVDHGRPEALLVVEHIMGDAQPVGHPAGVVDVLAGAARPAAPRRLPMIVELQRDADHVMPLAAEETGHDR